MNQKIAIVTHAFSSQHGGAVGVAYDQARALQQLECDVFIFSGTSMAKDSWEEEEGVHIFRAPIREMTWMMRSYKSLRNRSIEQAFETFLKKVKPDIVHFHNIYYQFPYSLFSIARKSGTKVVFTAHDVSTFAYAKLTHYIDPLSKEVPEKFDYQTSWYDNVKYAKKAFNPWRNQKIRRYLLSANAIIAVSYALHEALSQNKILNSRVVHNGIDTKEWDRKADLVSLKEKLGMGNKPVVLYLGRLTGAKGRDVLLRACQEISETTLLVIGENINGALERTIKKFKLEGRVIYVGPTPRHELYQYYQLADVVAVPSVCFDSFPTVNLEAMASKKPVVATCFGGSREIVVDGETGFIVNPHNTKVFAQKISALLDNKKLAKQFGEAGFNRVVQEFTQKQHINKLLNIYRDLW